VSLKTIVTNVCDKCGFLLEPGKTFTKLKQTYTDDDQHCRFCQANCPSLGKVKQ
jgi:hypothetical protein